MSERQHFSTIVAAMKGKPATNGWDVICSYSLAELNGLGGKGFALGTLPRRIELDTEVKVIGAPGNKSTCHWVLVLDDPKLAFSAAGTAVLTMPVADGTTASVTMPDGTQKTIPLQAGTHAVCASVPLCAVSSDGTAASDATSVTFQPGVEQEYHVVLHFQTDPGKLIFSLDPPATDNNIKAHADALMQNLATYFNKNVRSIDCVLASLSNKPAPSGAGALTPSAFAFATAGDGDDGVLSLYIRVEGSTSTPGSTSFQPAGVPILPVPTGFSASLII